jgi:hypothetical protein
VGGVPQKFIKISCAKIAVIELISGKFHIIRSPFLGEGGQHGARDLVYRVELRCHDNETFHQTILGRRNQSPNVHRLRCKRDFDAPRQFLQN